MTCYYYFFFWGGLYLEDDFFCFREFREVLAVFFQGKKLKDPGCTKNDKKREDTVDGGNPAPVDR